MCGLECHVWTGIESSLDDCFSSFFLGPFFFGILQGPNQGFDGVVLGCAGARFWMELA